MKMPLRKLQEIIIGFAEPLFSEGQLQASINGIEYPCHVPLRSQSCKVTFKVWRKRLMVIVSNLQAVLARWPDQRKDGYFPTVLPANYTSGNPRGM
jgi:hypothetical protein